MISRLAGAEGGHASGRVGRGENHVLVDVGAALVPVVGIAREHHPHLAGVLLQDVRPRGDHALLEVAVLLQDFLREEHGDGLGDVLREQHVGGLEVDAHRQLVRRLDALDLLEGERLRAFPGVGLEAVLDVGGHELAAVERRHVVPLHALAQLERPHPEVRARLPRLGEVALEGEVGRTAHLVGEPVAHEPAADQARELVEPDRLGQARVDDRRIPRGSARERAAPLGRARAGRDPLRVGGPGLGGRPASTGAGHEGAGPETGPSCAREEPTAIQPGGLRGEEVVVHRALLLTPA